ncbi:PrgI family protein [Paenibacillus sp. GXUN7292]|uniref:PrgI family protein n=1 Tax=Paenibacillus sp. GXUN7292 TaxID=3422499 RepID=UPI003D7DBBE2
MKTYMPFNTESERKPLKVWEFAFSWRQTLYIAITLVALIQLGEYVVFKSAFPFTIKIVLFVLCLLVFVPAIVLGFVKNEATGLFLDRYLLYYFRFKKNESGVWRR